MIIWFLMLIPIIATIILLMFSGRKVVWWEYILLYAVSIFVIFISKLIIETSNVYTTEYLGEKAIEVKYHGAYDEYISQTCQDCTSSTDSDGNTTETCVSYDCSYVEQHSTWYEIIGEKNSIEITEREYTRIKNKWRNLHKTGSHSDSYTYDYGIYSSFWPKNKELVECIVTSGRYENRVKATQNVFTFQKVTDEDKKKHGLYDYPKIYDGYKQISILGSGDKTQAQAEKKMQLLNAELGPKKQVKAFILLFKNKTKQSGIMQEAYWHGGNKNEFVLTIGVDGDNNVMWTHPFTWAERSIVKVSTADYVNKQDKLNLLNLSLFLYDELDSNFVRKKFSEFSYLTIEPSGWAIFWSGFFLIVITCFIVYWILNNEFED